MPIRLFRFSNVGELKDFARSCEQALMPGGNFTELRNNHTGFLTQSKAKTDVQIQNVYQAVCYEIYIRGRLGDVECAGIVPRNPYLEKGMKVHSRSAVGIFGFPYPAPTVLPSP